MIFKTQQNFNTIACIVLVLGDISSTIEKVVPPTEEIVKKAFVGHKYSFEIYKRFSDKIELLDSALKTFDGDIILNVSLAVCF